MLVGRCGEVGLGLPFCILVVLWLGRWWMRWRGRFGTRGIGLTEMFTEGIYSLE